LKPRVDFSGIAEGDSHAVLRRALKTMRNAEISEERVRDFLLEALSGDYEHLLFVCQKYLEVENSGAKETG